MFYRLEEIELNFSWLTSSFHSLFLLCSVETLATKFFSLELFSAAPQIGRRPLTCLGSLQVWLLQKREAEGAPGSEVLPFSAGFSRGNFCRSSWFRLSPKLECQSSSRCLDGSLSPFLISCVLILRAQFTKNIALRVHLRIPYAGFENDFLK